MICAACQTGNHNACSEGECACEERQNDLIQAEALKYAKIPDGIAETIYSNLLYSGSTVCRIMTDGAGKDKTKLFIKQVIGALRAFNN